MVIADSSVLIHLARIERLDLLRYLYHHVLIPRAVQRETVGEGRGRMGAADIHAAIEAGWIKVGTVPPTPLLHMLLASLDEGEAEVLALAVHDDAALVLIDERQAREAGNALGLTVTGTLGILMRARRRELIPSLKAELDRLRKGGLYWISDTLYERALRDAGELSSS